MLNNWDIGEHEERPISVTFSDSTENLIDDNNKMTTMTKGWNLHFMYLQFVVAVTMGAGGGLANAKQLFKIISSLTLKLGELNIYLNKSGDELAHLCERLGMFGHNSFPAVMPVALPGAEESASFVFNVPLLFPDVKYGLGAEAHCWPSEIMRHLKLTLSTAAVTAVDPNVASITGLVRIKAHGTKYGDMIMAPIPEYLSHGNISQQLNLMEGNTSFIRSMFAYSADGFGDNLTDKDVLMLDGQNYFDQHLTVGDLLNRGKLRELIESGGVLTRDASTGAQTGVTDTTYPQANYIDYIAARGDLGDSPLSYAKEVLFAPAEGATRKLYTWRYRRTGYEVLKELRRVTGMVFPTLQKITHVRGKYTPVDPAKGTMLPVMLGERA